MMTSRLYNREPSLASRRAGFTLIELLIVIGIIGVVATLGVGSISKTYHSKAKQLTWRMTSMIKYLYNSAITENKTQRLVIDFESNSYWAENTNDKFLLEKSDSKDKKEKKDQKKEEQKKQVSPDSAGTDKSDKDNKDEVNYVEPMEATFGSVESLIIEAKTLPTGISFKDVWTEEDKQPIGSGRAYVYFFPSGYAEAAVINFKDASDEKHVSLKINPMNGDVDIVQDYRKLEEQKNK